MSKCFKVMIFVLLAAVLNSCASTMNPNFEPPVVSLHTFKVLPQQGITPSFEIGLQIINPNRDPLELQGIYYTVGVEGYKILAGVSNELPTVKPYSKADITLIANVDIVRGISFISSLMQDPRDSFEYSFDAKLDPGGFTPKILIREKGTFNLKNRM